MRGEVMPDWELYYGTAPHRYPPPSPGLAVLPGYTRLDRTWVVSTDDDVVRCAVDTYQAEDRFEVWVTTRESQPTRQFTYDDSEIARRSHTACSNSLAALVPNSVLRKPQAS
jgi:hypothetical protein